jgi:hypothetical protein
MESNLSEDKTRSVYNESKHIYNSPGTKYSVISKIGGQGRDMNILYGREASRHSS